MKNWRQFVNSRKKCCSSLEKFPSFVLSWIAIIFQRLIIQFLSSGRLREVKNKRNFQTFSSKSGRSRLQEATWSLGRGGCLREVLATGGSTIFLEHFNLSQISLQNGSLHLIFPHNGNVVHMQARGGLPNKIAGVWSPVVLKRATESYQNWEIKGLRLVGVARMHVRLFTPNLPNLLRASSSWHFL